MPNMHMLLEVGKFVLDKLSLCIRFTASANIKDSKVVLYYYQAKIKGVCVLLECLCCL